MLDRRLRRPADPPSPPNVRIEVDLSTLGADLEAIERGTVSSAVLLAVPVFYRAYVAGYAKGVTAAERIIADLQRQLEAAEHDADRWYEKAHNPGRALSEIRDRRMRQALEDAFWAGELRTVEDEVRVAVAACAPLPRTAA